MLPISNIELRKKLCCGIENIITKLRRSRGTNMATLSITLGTYLVHRKDETVLPIVTGEDEDETQ